MSEEALCSVCGQPKKKVTLVMKLRWLDYKAKQKVVKKLMSNYKICPECKQKVKMEHESTSEA